MKFSILLLFIAVLFLGCSNNIKKVQDASPEGYSSITYKQLFGNHNEFGNTYWEERETERGEKVVIFSGYFKSLPNKLFQTKVFTAEFIMDINEDKFKVGYFAIELDPNENAIKYLNLPIPYSKQVDPSEAINLMYNKEYLSFDFMTQNSHINEEQLALDGLVGFIKSLNLDGVRYCMSIIGEYKKPESNYATLRGSYLLEAILIDNATVLQDRSQTAKGDSVIAMCNLVSSIFGQELPQDMYSYGGFDNYWRNIVQPGSLQNERQMIPLSSLNPTLLPKIKILLEKYQMGYTELDGEVKGF